MLYISWVALIERVDLSLGRTRNVGARTKVMDRRDFQESIQNVSLNTLIQQFNVGQCFKCLKTNSHAKRRFTIYSLKKPKDKKW